MDKKDNPNRTYKRPTLINDMLKNMNLTIDFGDGLTNLDICQNFDGTISLVRTDTQDIVASYGNMGEFTRIFNV